MHGTTFKDGNKEFSDAIKRQRPGRRAPWPDFAGNPIDEGDWIEHPTGDKGKVKYHMGTQYEGVSRWRVVYRDGESLWLGNQIGDKGRAVVVKP